MQPEILLLGGGYTLKRVAEMLPAGSFVVTTTSPTKLEVWRKRGILCEIFNAENEGSLLEVASSYPDIKRIVDSIPPPKANPLLVTTEVHRAFYGKKLERVVCLSTSGVFGAQNGEVVTEETAADPKHTRAECRLQVEKEYTCLFDGIELCCLRLPAIYGPGRGIGTALKAGRFVQVGDDSKLTNRIQVDDLARVICAALQHSQSLPPVLVVGDGHPAPQGEVIEYYCKRFDLKAPERISVEQARASGRLSQLSNQALDNSLMLKTLGISMDYPTYREGAETEFE